MTEDNIVRNIIDRICGTDDIAVPMVLRLRTELAARADIVEHAERCGTSAERVAAAVIAGLASRLADYRPPEAAFPNTYYGPGKPG